MVRPGDTYPHGEYGRVEVLAIRTALDTVISDGALTKTRVVEFDTEYDPARPETEPGPGAVETETLDEFISNVAVDD